MGGPGGTARKASKAGVSAPAGDTEHGYLRPLSVLIVEADPIHTRLIEAVLENDSGGRYSTAHASSLASALHELKREKPDVILLSLDLPNSDGWDTYEAIRAISRGIPIVLSTVDQDAALGLRVIRHGAQDVVDKRMLAMPGMAIKALQYAVQRETDSEKLRKSVDDLRDRENELRQALVKLKRTQMSLVEAERFETVGRMSAGVAHEVKNPLAIIRFGVDYLSRRLADDDGTAQGTVKDICAAIDRADRIVGDLLEYAAPRPMKFDDVSLNDVVREAEYLVKHQAREKSLHLHSTYDPALPPLSLDRQKMVQVFVNLMMNAIQATPHGGRLMVMTRQDALEAVLGEPAANGGDPRSIMCEITDSGPGVPPEALKKVFEPFFTTKKDHQGVGLGLPVSLMIVEMHGGSLLLENNPAGGARARVVFVT